MHQALEGVGIVVIALAGAHQTGRHVGAVVGDALHIVQHIQEHHAGINGADAILQALDVAVAELLHQNVDDLFQRLHLTGQRDVIVLKGIVGTGQDLLQRGIQQFQLVLGNVAEGGFFLVELHSLFLNVHGVVADALELGDKVQQLGHGMALVISQLLIGHLNKVIGDGHLHAVDEVLPHLDGAHGVLVHLQQQRRSQIDVAGGTAGHFDHRVLGLLQGHGRALEQTLVQHRHAQFLRFLSVVRHREHGQLGQHTHWTGCGCLRWSSCSSRHATWGCRR